MLQSASALPPSPPPPPTLSAGQSPAANGAADIPVPESMRRLILNHQQTILGASKLARCLSRHLQEQLPDNAIPAANLDGMTDEDRCQKLLSTVKALDLFFTRSKIARKEYKERWQAEPEEKEIDKLTDQEIEEIVSILKECQLASAVPPQISGDTALLFAGAAIPRMYSRLTSKVLSGAPAPQIQMCMGSARVLNKDIDKLNDEITNQEVMDRIDQLVTRFSAQLGDRRTETHAFMALVDIIRKKEPECSLNQQQVFLCHTGLLSFDTQLLQDSGAYLKGAEQRDQRPNTEATFQQALHALQHLNDAIPNKLVLVSNQPHVTSQRLAAERVAALDEFRDLPPIMVESCGDENTLAQVHAVFNAIDAVRKSVQLLNPSYQVIENVTTLPARELFRLSEAGDWQYLGLESSAIQPDLMV